MPKPKYRKFLVVSCVGGRQLGSDNMETDDGSVVESAMEPKHLSKRPKRGGRRIQVHSCGKSILKPRRRTLVTHYAKEADWMTAKTHTWKYSDRQSNPTKAQHKAKVFHYVHCTKPRSVIFSLLSG